MAVAIGTGIGALAVRHANGRLSPTQRVAPLPTSEGGLGARVLVQGPPERAEVCLTFDDGPSPYWTPFVLDLLAEHGLRATFFVLGESARDHPGLLAREVGAGHEVGVHNWAHTDVYGVEVEELRGSVDRTLKAVQDAGAPAPRLWRPPYGRVDAPALMVAAERDLDLVLWSLHTPSPGHARAVAAQARPGSVILSHDARGQPTEELLRAVVGSAVALRERGLALVTCSQMLEGTRRAEGAGRDRRRPLTPTWRPRARGC